jgi:hypothetical protein
MRVLLSAGVLILALAATYNLVNGSGEQIEGIIMSVSAQSFTIRTASNKAVKISILPSTMYYENSKGLAADLKPGARVKVDTSERGGQLYALKITVKRKPIINYRSNMELAKFACSSNLAWCDRR